MTIPLPDYSLHDEATLFLAHPKVELSGPDPFKQIFTNFTPRPHFVLLTGPCNPLPGSEFTSTSPDSSNDCVQAVVVTSRVPQPIEGEVQYLTELMKLKGEIENVHLKFQILDFGQKFQKNSSFFSCSYVYHLVEQQRLWINTKAALSTVQRLNCFMQLPSKLKDSSILP